MIKRLLSSFSILGLLIGLLFLCISLTPSLLPRVPAVQGVLGGFALAVGYFVGKVLRWIWWLLELPEVSGPVRRISLWVLGAVLGVLTVVTFSRIAVWQNSIRELMGMERVDSGYPWTVAAIAIVTALVIVLIVRAILWLIRLTNAQLERVLPGRLAKTLGTVLALFAVFTLVNDFVVQKALRALDNVFFAVDTVTEDGVEPPATGHASGGPGSVVDWDDIGTNGKDFLIDGPDRAEISAFTGRPAKQPVRVYAGYGSGKDFEERAEIALRDLIALGGFDRSVLVVATPTGTGWLDPASVQPLAYMHGGDLAIVSMQYTYVPSWLSIMVEPDRSRRAARALFDVVYDHWKDLPKDERPRLYLFGLSLGALGAEASSDLVTIFADPIQGGLFSGPPFASTTWAAITAARNPGSPAWLPEYRDGSVVRFMNQHGIADPESATWGPMRMIYLQYASDPMVFFSPRLAFHRPDWLGADRGPDVSPYFDWYPLVTFLQVGFDVPMATSTPSGHGHTYDAQDYIEGWVEVSEPDGWSTEDTGRLKALFADFSASPI